MSGQYEKLSRPAPELSEPLVVLVVVLLSSPETQFCTCALRLGSRGGVLRVLVQQSRNPSNVWGLCVFLVFSLELGFILGECLGCSSWKCGEKELVGGTSDAPLYSKHVLDHASNCAGMIDHNARQSLTGHCPSPVWLKV